MSTSKHEDNVSSRPPVSNPRSGQQHYISNLRSSLTALVILHHTAISYGGDGTAPFQSSLHPPASSPVLVGFVHLNQTFFMGSFFYLAGHFTKRTLQRKSHLAFVKDRLYRLGAAAVAFTLIGPPMCTATMLGAKGQRVGWNLLMEHLKGLRGMRGPVWFLATLMMFDLVLASSPALLRATTRPVETPSRRISTQAVLLGVGLCSATEFLLRLRYPIGYMFRPLSINVGHLPQYIACYLFGTWANDVKDCLPSPAATGVLLLASVASSAHLALSFASDRSTLTKVHGGANMHAALYAVYSSTTGYLLGTGLLAAFSRYATHPWHRTNALAYPAFVVHYPVYVALGALTDEWRLKGVLKTVIIGSASIVGSWVVGGIAITLGRKMASIGSTLRHGENGAKAL